MKYKLINKTTSEEHLCKKVRVLGWDYYVSDEPIKDGERGISINNAIYTHSEHLGSDYGKKLIATNNPIIDIPKVVDEVEILTESQYPTTIQSFNDKGFDEAEGKRIAFEAGYNKSQETHPFDEEDMIEFLNWIRDNTVFDSAPKPYHRKTQTRLSQEELLQLWKEERPKTLYYE